MIQAHVDACNSEGEDTFCGYFHCRTKHLWIIKIVKREN